MRLILLTVLTMAAFAANSVLTRAAVEGGHLSSTGFALIRVAAGASTLVLISLARRTSVPLFDRSRLVGAVSLSVYMAGFSLAYMTLDAGLGALILFGVTQITMFGYSAVTVDPPSARQIAGAVLAFFGLTLVLWPAQGSAVDVQGAILMIFAGIGWAVYTIAGRGAKDPLATTSANFLLAVPFMILLILGQSLAASAFGIMLAVVCGAVTSGLGYALWYSVLPQMRPATAAVVQLSVPVLAMAAGAVLLSETVTPILLIAGALVVGGIGWSVTAKK